MQKVQTTAVRFKVARAIELEPGLVLRPGVYIGAKTRTRVDSIGGVSWTRSQYKLEFTADQLTRMGAQARPNLIAKNIDVTKFVRLGKVIVLNGALQRPILNDCFRLPTAFLTIESEHLRR
jgi:hypothetical protein